MVDESKVVDLLPTEVPCERATTVSGREKTTISHRNQLRQLQEMRREQMRLRLVESQQISHILKDLRDFSSLQHDVENSPTSRFNREFKEKKTLQLNILDKKIKHRLSLLNKVLPDMKDITLEDNTDSAPRVTLRVINPELEVTNDDE